MTIHFLPLTNLADRFKLAALILATLTMASCNSPADTDSQTKIENGQPTESSTHVQEKSDDAWRPERVESEHLPNAYRLTSKVISGGLPEDEAAFQELADIGVKTIISVDGAQPNLELAHQFGLRYVHLPHGYDGVPESRAQELAKAVLDLEGPIYIHCHHGKHRSPAAATVACVGAGLLRPEVALSVLQTAGTSEHYEGLYEAAAQAHPLDRALLEQLNPSFSESVEVPPMAKAMVDIEHTFDRIKLIRQSAWSVPKQHPDLAPAHEALMLREHFTELMRTAEVDAFDEPFRTMLQESETAAKALESSLRASENLQSLSDIEAAYETISSNCKSCHVKFRDVR